MSDDDVSRDGPRVGRWLPSYTATGRRVAAGRRDAAANAAPADPAPADPAPDRTVADDAPNTGRSWLLVALAGATGLSLLVLVLAAAGRWGAAAPGGTGEGPNPVLIGGPPGSVAVSDSHDRLPTTTPDPGRSIRSSGATTESSRPGSAPPSAAPGGGTGSPATPPGPTAAVDVPLTIGGRVGLAPTTRPGYRVRHAGLTARLDAIGPDSGTADRSDSTFAVRTGLADSGCVSFESVNYPGYFLRHQNFQLYLHRRDGTSLFAADATFCPVTGLAGRHTSFRSVNYPSRYLRQRGDQVYLDPPDGAEATRAAMTFAVQAGLS